MRTVSKQRTAPDSSAWNEESSLMAGRLKSLNAQPRNLKLQTAADGSVSERLASNARENSRALRREACLFHECAGTRGLARREIRLISRSLVRRPRRNAARPRWPDASQ